MAIKIDRKLSSFVLPEGILSFIFAFPGQAQDCFGNKAYQIEWSGDIPQNHEVVRAASYVAQLFDAANWTRHVFGPMGRIQKLEEKTKRDASKYQYAAGKYIINASKVCSLKSLKLGDLNLALPEHRARYDTALNAAAPLVYRFVNLSDPADIARIEQMQQDMIRRGVPVPANPPQMIPLMPHEVWPGCYGSVSGYFYWNENGKPATLGIGLNHILMTRQGERIIGESSPDSAFAEFAPAAELAPSAPAAAGWGNLI